MARFNQQDWPQPGAWRDLLVLLDELHLQHGCPSLREIANLMRLDHSRVSALVRGQSLPTSGAQARGLALAIIGAENAEAQQSARQAVELFVKARRERNETIRTHGEPAGASSPEAVPAGKTEAIDPPAEVRSRETAAATPPGPVKRTPGPLVLVGAAVLVSASILGAVFLTVGDSATAPPVNESSSALGPEEPTRIASSPVTTEVRSVGRTTMQVVYDNPGGCSRTYIVSGETNGDPRIGNRSLWVVKELYADPEGARPNALYFAKARVNADGRFSVAIKENTESGVRQGRVVLVAADALADQELQLNYDSDVAGDDRYPDGRRVRLPPGSEEIAGGPTTEQRC